MARRYSVWVAGTNERVDRGGLSLDSAKDLARIGSQYGGAREVVRGTSGTGMVVRIYRDGARVFPLGQLEFKCLYSSEYPRNI